VSDRLLLKGGRLVDPSQGIDDDVDVLLEDGRVAEVTSGGVASPPAGTEIIDARGMWIVPGLIDMHVHYHPGWMDALFLRHGVTTVRDVGSGLDSILELREDSRAPGVARPRIFACGPLIDGPSPRRFPEQRAICLTLCHLSPNLCPFRRLLYDSCSRWNTTKSPRKRT